MTDLGAGTMGGGASDDAEPSVSSSGTARTPPARIRRGAPLPHLAAEDREAPPLSAAPETPPDEASPGAWSNGWDQDPGATPPPGTGAEFDWFGGRPQGEATAASESVLAPSDSAFDRDERPAKVKLAKRQERRFRQTVERVDLWSVTKLALCFYVSVMAVAMVSVVALWVVADSAGIIDNVENFIGDLFSSDDFQFVSGEVLRGAILVSVVLVALMVVFTIVAASLYNIFAELFGGVEVVIREEENPPKR